MAESLIQHSFNSSVIYQRPDNGYINLNQMADATGKRVQDWLDNQSTKALIEQLITWTPTTKGKTDLVMALWFCEIRAREMLNHGMYTTHHLRNPFLSRSEKSKRVVVNLDQLLLDQNKQFI